MVENLAREICEQEENAKGIIADAKIRAAEIIAGAQTGAERSMKNTRQHCHRQLRESIENAEQEAEAAAVDILLKGQQAAKDFYDHKKGSAAGVADWLVREVIGTYGSCRDD